MATPPKKKPAAKAPAKKAPAKKAPAAKAKPAPPARKKAAPKNTESPARVGKKKRTAGKDMTAPGPLGPQNGSGSGPMQGTAPQSMGGIGLGGYGM